MARENVTLMCYWNGRITNGAQGITYEGAVPKPTRYPTREFIHAHHDDESLDIVFDVARKPGTNCLELYLEREPASKDSQIVVDGDKCNANPDTFLDPGPSDKSVLVLQDQHRSEAIWAGEDPGVLTCRQRLGTMMREWRLDHRIRHFVVEGWVLWVISSADLQWDNLCEELLRVRPDPSVLHDKSGSDVQLIFLPLLRDFKHAGKFSWGSAILAYLYRELCRANKKGASEISGPLMLLQLWAWERLHIGRPERFVAQEQDPVVPDGEAVKNKVQFSEVEMVNQETLPVDPLGYRWRCPIIRRDNPQRALIFYRDQLDQQTYDQMYVLETSMCGGQLLHLSALTLLSGIVLIEFYASLVSNKEFCAADTRVKIHAIDRRGRHHCNWKAYHQQYIKLWASREKSIVTAEPEESTMDYHDSYMKCYRSITRRLITPLTQRPHKRIQPASGMSHLLVHSLTNIHNQCTATLSTFTSESAMQSLTNIRITCTRIANGREIRHLETVTAPTITMAPPSPSQANDMEGLPLLIAQMPTKTKSLLVRGRGRAKGRGRALGTQQKAMEPVITLQHSSPQVVVASLTTPSQNNDIHIEEPSTLNLDGSATPAESMHPLEGETTTEKVPLYPHYDYEESPCLTQVESSHVTRHKKKPKVL
ncbi:hypothetical protein Pint_14547 [Pistacia integerrima]|uniref:Uncharacterized protein n=1 Tax=Pistacia integerrima TaxID=434235 RepID=A0ACC0Y698_9ROSI|nr:hypothetical protein Pint_14547 [Pistacia integerrima]